MDLGFGYKNRQECGVFDQRQKLAYILGKCKFFSVQTVGSTDSVNLK